MSKYLDLIEFISDKYTDMAPVIDIANNFFVEIEKAMPDSREYKKAITELEKLAYDINKPEAEDIIKHMKPYGMKWTYKDIEQYVQEKGVKGDYISWWLVMNMMYNDYRGTAEMYDLAEDVNFYYNLSNNFINDIDGGKFKVQKYFLDM